MYVGGPMSVRGRFPSKHTTYATVFRTKLRYAIRVKPSSLSARLTTEWWLRGCPWRAKGQDQRGEGGFRPCSMMHWSDEPHKREKGQNAHPPPRSQSQTQTPAQLKERDVTNLSGWVAVVVLCVWCRTQDWRGNGDTQQDWWVNTQTSKLWLRSSWRPSSRRVVVVVV